MGILVFLKEEMGVGRGREEPLTSWVHPLKWGHFVKTGCFKLGVYWLVCDKINLFGCDHKKKIPLITLAQVHCFMKPILVIQVCICAVVL